MTFSDLPPCPEAVLTACYYKTIFLLFKITTDFIAEGCCCLPACSQPPQPSQLLPHS